MGPTNPSPGLQKNREIETGGASKSLLLKSSLQRLERVWRAVVAVVKVQPGCRQARRRNDRQTDTTEDCFFFNVWSKAMEKEREARGNGFREGWLPGPEPYTKGILLLLREENIHSLSIL